MSNLEEHEKRIALAHAALRSAKVIAPVRRDEAERRLWQNHDLASFVEHRLGLDVDPLTLAEPRCTELFEQATDEGQFYAAHQGYSIPYWVHAGDETVGTVSLSATSFGGSTLGISSLYIRQAHRRRGHARRLISALEEATQRAGLWGIQLDTGWCWQPAIKLYLAAAMWVRMWKRDLNLVLRKDLPRWSVDEAGDEARFCVSIEGHPTPVTLLIGRRRGTRLEMTECAAPAADGEVRWLMHGTFALALAVRGWPLVTSDEAWGQQCQAGFSDGGDSNGLAFKIVRWEAWAHHRRWLVNTPSIPGLEYPSWEELYPDDD